MSDEIEQNSDDTSLSNDDLGGVTGGAAPKAVAAAAGATAAGRGGTNPLHNAEPSTELPEAALDNVAGGSPATGKVDVKDISITKKVDVSSPNLF